MHTSRRLAISGLAVAPALAMARPQGMLQADPERRMQRRISHFMDAIEATPEQRSRLMAIAASAWKDLRGQSAQIRDLRERSLAVLASANVDRSAAESLRAQSAALRDAQSKRTLAAMLDGSQVLTPAQRTKAAEMLKKRGAGGRGRGFGSNMHQSGEDDGGLEFMQMV
jgi:periplasmic protein CpxP/Spy